MIVEQRTRVIIISDPDRPVIPAQMTYDPADPYAIKVTFTLTYDDGRTEALDWWMSRELLVELFTSNSAGLCDVKWRFFGTFCTLTLNSPEGIATIQFDTPDLEMFLENTKVECPVGSETLDLDGLVHFLLHN